jgi:ribosomal protein S18 acetylase RimI-like enzyme
VGYAEEFAREKGFTRMGIKTTPDNTPARALYENLGYTLTDQNNNLTYIKDIGRNT